MLLDFICFFPVSNNFGAGGMNSTFRARLIPVFLFIPFLLPPPIPWKISMFSDMSNSIPGVDEAMSFAELMKMVQTMDFSCIVFDTAPTGHTLRLLSFPTIMDKALSKLVDLKNRFSGLLSQFGSMFGGGAVSKASCPRGFVG